MQFPAWCWDQNVTSNSPAKMWSLLASLAVVENIKNKHCSKLISFVISVLMYWPTEGDFTATANSEVWFSCYEKIPVTLSLKQNGDLNMILLGSRKFLWLKTRDFRQGTQITNLGWTKPGNRRQTWLSAQDLTALNKCWIQSSLCLSIQYGGGTKEREGRAVPITCKGQLQWMQSAHS